MGETWERSVSWSKMSTYNRCPRQFKFKYIDDFEEDDDQGRQDGIDFHEYMDEYYDLSTDGPSESTAVTLAQELFTEDQQARYRPWIEQWHQWNEWLFEKWGEEHWKPISTEEWVEVEIDGYTHHGYVDAIHWDPDEETYGVIDYKPNAKDSSHYKGQIAYYGEFLLAVSDLLDDDVEWGGVYGYKGGKFKRWDIHWASRKATKRKIDALVDLDEGYDADFGYHCQWCPFVEECVVEEESNGGAASLI